MSGRIAYAVTAIVIAWVGFSMYEGKRERKEKLANDRSEALSWCATRSATAFDYSTAEYGRTSAYYYDVLVGNTVCLTNAKVDDVVTDGQNTALVFSAPFFPAQASCIYPISAEDYRKADILTSVRIVFIPTNIDVDRRDPDISRKIRGICTHVEMRHFDRGS